MGKNRAKKIFRNFADCIQVFAQQSQEYAEHASRSRNDNSRITPVYFSGKNLYSYGPHYLLARIGETKDGARIAFLNCTGYSRTTSKHFSCARSTLASHGYKVLEVADSETVSIREGVSDADLWSLAVKGLRERRASLLAYLDDARGYYDAKNFFWHVQEFNSKLERIGLDTLKIKRTPELEDKAKKSAKTWGTWVKAQDDHRTRRQTFFDFSDYRSLRHTQRNTA